MTKIYMAGPLFTSYERRWNSELAFELKNCGHDVFLPQDHEMRDRDAETIFQGNVTAITQCDVVIANLDQPDPDSGTCWEVGFAYANGVPVFFYRTDFRTFGEFANNPVNLMLTQSATMIKLGLEDITVKKVAQKIHETLNQI